MSKYSGVLESCPYNQSSINYEWVLVSFDLVKFIEFLLLVGISGPLFYRFISSMLNLERHYFSLVGLFNFSKKSFLYLYVVFTLGNYAHTLNYVTVLAYYFGLFGYTALVELPFLKVNLPGWRQWSRPAWIVHISALIVVLACIGYFIYESIKGGLFWVYLLFFIFAVSSIVEPFIVCKYNNSNIEKYPDGSPYSRVPRMLYLYFKQGHWRSKEVKNVLPTRHSNEASLESPVQTEGHELNYFRSFTNTTQQNNNASMQFPGGNYTSEGNELRNNATPMEAPGESKTSEHSDSASFETLRERIFREAKPDYLSFSAANPAGKVKYMVHIHHWQLFYILAFFTRFPTTVSRICAGLVLGIYTQGCVAYGHGEILETL